MSKKRTSLEAVLGEDPSVVEPESTRQDGPPNNLTKTSGKRPGIKQQTAYLGLPGL